ncbi:MAG TPA: integrase [Chromatiales bacterium]|nr:integrase [Chromatiales bacterium]
MKLDLVVADYITLKRAAGARFKTAEGILQAFSRTVGRIEVREVTKDTVLAFLNGSRAISSSWHLKHYTLAGLFRFALQRGLVSASPLPDRVPRRPPYAMPYIYSAEELKRLLDATEQLDVTHPIAHAAGSVPALTYRTLLLLLYGAGLRLSEALALTVDDVDLAQHFLVVRGTKFFKSRLLPVGPRLSAVLTVYAERRRSLVVRPSGKAFFLRRNGTSISRETAERYFRIIRGRLGLARRDDAYFQPRLHDLRHTFAVHCLVAWYRQGADVQRLLPKLSTYLGHIGLAETQSYLTVTPDLLRLAGRRFESYAATEGRP